MCYVELRCVLKPEHCKNCKKTVVIEFRLMCFLNIVLKTSLKVFLKI